MSVCTIYLKGGHSFDLDGKGFSVVYGRPEGDMRKLKWESLNVKKGEALWLDMGEVAAVVVRN